jgi:hypothetical protein
MFQAKVLAAFDLEFLEENVFPLRKRGELEPTRVYLYPLSLCNIV